MSERRCDKCKWWNSTGHIERSDDNGILAGICHRYPPQGQIEYEFENLTETWADCWCGEFEEKPNE